MPAMTERPGGHLGPYGQQAQDMLSRLHGSRLRGSGLTWEGPARAIAACAVSRAVSRPVPHDMGAPISLAVVLSVLALGSAQTASGPCPGFRVSER